MAAYAVINDGEVINVVEWDGDTNIWSPPEGATTVLVQVGQVPFIGFGYAGGVFEEPPAVSPTQS